MALRKRLPRRHGLPRRQRRSTLPLVEDLEGRIVLSQGVPTSPAVPVPAPAPTPPGTLVPYPLAHGGTGWLMIPGAAGIRAPQGQGLDSPLGPGAPARG